MPKPEKRIHKIIDPKDRHWVGNGFYVSTMFSVHSEDYRYLSPFIMLDHAAPRYFAPTEEKHGVGEHPHRGFETVTFAIKGEIDHRDSGGGGGTIGTGGVQWMTAGEGVVHEEFHSRRFAESGGEFEMVQLWVNLPQRYKMTKPRYQSINRDQFPHLSHQGQEIKLIAGTFADKQGPALTHSPITMFEIFGKKPGKLELDFTENSNTIFIQIAGEASIGEKSIKQGQAVLFQRTGARVTVNIEIGSHILVLNGEPIDEPIVAYGPFVMNTREEIVRAFQDFQAGQMGQLVHEQERKET
ncbi:pirin family protein [Pseudobacteriovorax antillogorgiicola]